MKVDMIYSIHYLPHPWDDEARKAGVKAYCLCREMRLPTARLPTAPGLSRGHNIDYKPVALFNTNSEGDVFQRFIEELGIKTIEISPDVKDLIESERNLGRSRLKT
jgi:hypothetical protein